MLGQAASGSRHLDDIPGVNGPAAAQLAHLQGEVLRRAAASAGDPQSVHRWAGTGLARKAGDPERALGDYLVDAELLPDHTTIVELYVPPKGARNPAAQEEIDTDNGPHDAEQALAMPRVTAFRFRNTGASDADNCCASCPIDLGVGAGGTASNGMELRFAIQGHRPGMEYDITRTRRDSLWQRVAGVWSRVGSSPMGTGDDHRDTDECLAPRHSFIFVVDRPGLPGLALPIPAVALNAEAVYGPGAITSPTATDVVLRASFAEWVIARNRREGLAWTPRELPAFKDGSVRRFVFWRCVVWIRSDGAGNFVLDAARCRIELGTLSSAVLLAAPA